MKRLITTLILSVMTIGMTVAAEPIKLNAPSKKRGSTLQEALWNRKTVREWSSKELSKQDLSDLLWASVGQNRPDGKRTAPTAMNRQEVKVYVLTDEAAYLYDAKTHMLQPLTDGDYRMGCRGNQAPVDLVVVVDEEWRWSGVDSGYVAQNIYLFCAANGMGTVSCGMGEDANLRKVLKLDEKQAFVLHNPVGYLK